MMCRTLAGALAGALLAAGCGGSPDDVAPDPRVAPGAPPALGAASSARAAIPDSALADARWARTDTGEPEAATADASRAPAPVTGTDLRLEVDVDARKLHVYRGEARTATYGVAVGSAQWPTQRGQWRITQVIWNPAWIPPDESWADAREPKAPGDPDNPLGRAQLVYDPPRTVHGTNQPASIGRAVSHGSVRMTNATIVRLARQVMDASGAGRDEAWYRQVSENRRTKQIVDLPVPVPIRVY